MNNKKLFGGFLSAAAVLTLAACGNNSGSNGSNSSAPALDTNSFKQEVTNEGTAINGGTVNVAMISASPFKGFINPVLYVDAGDGALVDMAYTSLFEYDANLKIDNSKGMATYELNRDNKTFTIKLKSADYKWSDGQPLNIDDYIFTLQTIADPNYEGVRYGEDTENIEGVKEFHEGQATSISGVEKVDDQTVILHLKEIYPALEYGGDPIPSSIIPKHIFDGMSYQQMVESDASRTAVVGNGPFIVKQVVSGESVTFEKNPYYYKGQPKVDAKVDVVSPDQIVSEVKAGHYDIVDGMPSDQYETYKDFTNVDYLGKMTNSISYIGFNLGHFDEATGTHVMDSSKKMSDPALRQAIGYAVDNDTVGKETYNGLQVRANTLISPFFGDLSVGTDVVPGFEYNPEKAKQLLADAGYKDTDGDGFVEDKNGQPLTITLMSAKGSDTAEAVLQQYLTWWKEVGLNVQLLNGRTLDFSNYAEKLQKYADDFDMWIGGFTIGYNPNPSGLYGPKAAFNFGHYNTEASTALMNRIDSDEAFDDAKRKDMFKQWEELVQKDPFNIPRFFSYNVSAVNKRVKHYDITTGTSFGWEQVELTADTGVASN